MSEENKNDSEIKEGVVSNIYKIIGLVVVAAGVIVFTLYSGNSHADPNDGCRVNDTSPFGQAPVAQWVELNTYQEAYAVSYFDMNYPKEPIAGYPEEHFRAYNRQYMEVYFTNAQGEEGIRFTKGYTCNGAEVYDTSNATFRSTVIQNVDDIDVTERGDGDTVSLATWYVGDYSYGINAMKHPLSREEMEALVRELN